MFGCLRVRSDEVFAHGSEDIEQHACLDGNGPMDGVWRDEEAVALLEAFGTTGNGHVEDTGLDEAALDMGMRVKGTHGSRLEGHTHHHHLRIVGEDFAAD